MRRTLLSILAFLFSSPGYSLPEISIDELKKELDLQAKNLPIQLDAFTSLTSILVLPPKSMLYKYAIDLDKIVADSARQAGISPDQLLLDAINKHGSIEKWLKAWGDEYIAPLHKRQNCTTPATLRIIQSGFKINHTIYDMHGNFLYENYVNKEVCEDLFSPTTSHKDIRQDAHSASASPKASYEGPSPINGGTYPLSHPTGTQQECEFKAVMTNEDMQRCGINQ